MAFGRFAGAADCFANPSLKRSANVRPHTRTSEATLQLSKIFLLIAAVASTSGQCEDNAKQQGDEYLHRLGFTFIGEYNHLKMPPPKKDAPANEYYVRVASARVAAELLSTQVPADPNLPQYLVETYSVNCSNGSIRRDFTQQFDADWKERTRKMPTSETRWILPTRNSAEFMLRSILCK